MPYDVVDDIELACNIMAPYLGIDLISLVVIPAGSAILQWPIDFPLVSEDLSIKYWIPSRSTRMFTSSSTYK